ncbi:MAG TPA: LysR substrate-binding domain-containing protein [Xanthobacteraceae bacterium]|nr:LysR substrate-binding domain-containing protein [Xanthobacteraceae bacterium]
MATKTLDLDDVRTFTLVASLANFTRVAEAIGTTQAAVSLKLKRLETLLGRRLVERTPRSVRLTAEGEVFLAHAKALLAANERALAVVPTAAHRLRLGISDHAAGPELPTLLARLNAADPTLALDVSIGFSQALREAFDAGKFDGVIVRQERSHRGGEILARDEYAWFASPAFERRAGESLRLASLAPPCGVRALAVRALDKARIPWREVFVGGGVAALAAAVSAGLGVAAFARRVAPVGSIDVGATLKLPRLPRTNVMLYSRVSDARGQAAFRVLAAAFRGMA